MAYSIAVLSGDGIGPEVVAATVQVLERVGRLGGFAWEFQRGFIGGAAIDHAGHPLPTETECLVKRADAVLLGAVGGPEWAQSSVTPERGLLLLREALGLFANIRPFEVLPGLEAASPLKIAPRGGIIVRELLGGIYYGSPRGRRQREDQVMEAIDTASYTVPQIERLARIGFQLAARQKVPLISVDKANVLETSKLWRETVVRLGEREFPGVPVIHRYVDAAAMEMVIAPDRYQVVIADNLFGDILSDLAGGLVGSLGVMGSGTVRHWGRGPGLYEPIHGSAPDIAGQGISNPVGAIWSAALMMDWSLGLPEAAERVRRAVRRTVGDGVFTPDLGGRASTDDVVESVMQHLERASQTVR